MQRPPVDGARRLCGESPRAFVNAAQTDAIGPCALGTTSASPLSSALVACHGPCTVSVQRERNQCERPRPHPGGPSARESLPRRSGGHRAQTVRLDLARAARPAHHGAARSACALSGPCSSSGHSSPPRCETTSAIPSLVTCIVTARPTLSEREPQRHAIEGETPRDTPSQHW